MSSIEEHNKEVHHRRSIRLKGFDYSKEGLYFITICCQNRVCLFGEIQNNTIVLNQAGEMIEKWYRKLETKFPEIKCDEMIVMPNHLHCILRVIIPNDNLVGADPCVCPKTDAGEGRHVGLPLHVAVQWFKTMTTNEYIRGVKTLGWIPFDGKLWQRNYYEHIIRNDYSYQNITNYIIQNPTSWENDKLK